MPTFDVERIAKLREFGLSEYASRAYLALLELGTTEARDVSRLAKIPIAKVYSTLDQLHERGLAVVEPGPPKRFTPAPFSVFLQRRRDRLDVEMHNLRVAERTLLDLFPLRGTATADDRGAFFTLRGRESVVEKFAALMRSTQEEVLLLAADHFTQRGHVPALFAEAAKRGVALRALVHVDADTLPALRDMSAHTQLRAKPSAAGCPRDVAIAIFDSRQLMIVHFVPDDGSRFDGKDVAIVAGEAAMVRALRCILEPLWESAPPVDTAAR